MPVSMQVVGSPASSPSRRMACASSRAEARSGMNAPSPTFTSSTSRLAPAATFLDMIEVAISGIDGTVAVASRSAYMRRSAGTRASVWPATRHPHVAHLRDQLGGRQVDAEAGDRLQLVERAAGVAQAAAGELRHRHPARGHQRRHHQRRLVAHAAGRVLVGHRPADGRQVEPLARVDHGLAAGRPVSASVMPRRTTAIRKADSW